MEQHLHSTFAHFSSVKLFLWRQRRNSMVLRLAQVSIGEDKGEVIILSHGDKGTWSN